MVTLRFTSILKWACVSDSDHRQDACKDKKKHDARSKIDFIGIVGQRKHWICCCTTGPVRVTTDGRSGGTWSVGRSSLQVCRPVNRGAFAATAQRWTQDRVYPNCCGHQTVVDTRLLNWRLFLSVHGVPFCNRSFWDQGPEFPSTVLEHYRRGSSR